MTDHRIDPARLAAFLDGTLAPEEREDVLRILAESPEAYRAFRETAAVVHELDGEQSGHVAGDHVAAAAVVELSPQPSLSARRREWRAAKWITPIAVAAGIVVLVIARRDRSAETTIPFSAMLLETARGSGTLARSLGASWDTPQWSAVRGDDAARGPRIVACRAGALAARLALSARLSDTAAFISTASTLAPLLSQVDGGAALSGVYQRLARGESLEGHTLATTIDQTRRLVGAVAWFDLGTWLESARLSADHGAVDFFANGSDGMNTLRGIASKLRSPQPDATSEAQATVLAAIDALLAIRDSGPSTLEAIRREIRIAYGAAAQ